MRIAFIGENVDSARAVSDYSQTHNYDIKFSGYIDSPYKIKKFVKENETADVLIIDVTNLVCITEDEFKEAIKDICSKEGVICGT